MVLVDTSIWIRFLAKRLAYLSDLHRLLEQEQVARHDLIYGELLVGDSVGRREMLRSYLLISKLPNASHEEVIELVRANKLHGRGIGWIDAHLLASCLIASVPLWTADERLAKSAGELGIAWHPRVH